jgi:voltage-gated potassium channel Kch
MNSEVNTNKFIDMNLEEAKHINKNFRLLALASIFTLANGTFVYHSIEKWSWVDSFYFSAVSLTTVGYGDLAPTTDKGKLFTVLYLFVGIGIIASLISNMIKNQTAKRRIKEQVNKK